MYILENGPYVAAIGGIHRPDLIVNTAWLDTETLDAPIKFTAEGEFSVVRPASQEDMQQPLPTPLLKASKVARARTASQSTVTAALLAHKFVELISNQPGYDPNRVAIGACSCSANATISWEFEMEGVTLGWPNTNTLLMPNALPSALSTQVSSAIKTHAAAISFLDDIMGMCSSIEYTYASFYHNRADYAFLIGAEEFSPLHDRIEKSKGDRVCLNMDGAAGVLLTRKPTFKKSWQLCMCKHLAAGQESTLPSDWTPQAGALHLPLHFEDKTVFSSLLLPYALYHLFNQNNSDRVVLQVTVADHGSFTLGFRHTEA